MLERAVAARLPRASGDALVLPEFESSGDVPISIEDYWYRILRYSDCRIDHCALALTYIARFRILGHSLSLGVRAFSLRSVRPFIAADPSLALSAVCVLRATG